MTELKLNYLNLGNMNFATLTLPAESEEVDAFFEKLNPMDSDCELQWVDVDGAETKANYNNLSLSELIQVAELDDIETFDKVFLACEDFTTALAKFDNGEYTIYTDCKNDYDLGYDLAVESGIVDPNSDNILHRYFDFEGYGRDCRLEGSYTRLDSDTLIELHY